MEYILITAATVFLIIFFAIIFIVRARKEASNTVNLLLLKEKDLGDKIIELHVLQQKIDDLENRIQSLSKYVAIENIDKEIEGRKKKFIEQRNAAIAKLKEQVETTKEKLRIADVEVQEKLRNAQKLRLSAIEDVEKMKKSSEQTISRQFAEANQRREYIFKASSDEAAQIIKQAEQRAEEIAGAALEAARNESQLKNAIKAMKNIIQGYGEEYIIPTQNLLDELAEEYDFKEAGQELKKARDKTRLIVKTQGAATCDYVEPVRRETATIFVLDAFNGKIDTILSKVKHDNYGKLRQQMIDAFNLVNNNGAAFRDARINPEYLDLRLNELKWAVAVQELALRDREEQRLIRQEMQEEERARKEYEKAIRDTEREEKNLQRAMEKTINEMATASEEQKAQFEAQLKDLEEKLKAAEEKNQRALSMAQQTRRGHVYVISNEGSFGKDVLKIGLTRRLDPLERVKELGDASVPFSFDVHAMMFSEDAPSLEKNLHNNFSVYQMNKVNPRKEFFKVSLTDVKEATRELGIEAHWTMKAEAREFRESLAMASNHVESKLEELSN